MKVRVERKKWHTLVTFDVYIGDSNFRSGSGYIEPSKGIRRVTINGMDCTPEVAREYAAAILATCDAVEEEPFK